VIEESRDTPTFQIVYYRFLRPVTSRPTQAPFKGIYQFLMIRAYNTDDGTEDIMEKETEHYIHYVAHNNMQVINVHCGAVLSVVLPNVKLSN